MAMSEKCELCCNERELQQSHIIPSFVFKWLKKTSVTGHFRFGEIPNQRRQDGYKLFLLCGDCEELFSKWEHSFANNIFEPINNENRIEPYGSWLLKFSTSVSWRILLFFKRELYLNHFPDSLISSVDNALTTWRDFLLDKQPHPGRFEQHILPFSGLISGYNFPDLPQNINRYIMRSIDMDVSCSQKEAYVYAKLGRILIFGFIEIQHPSHWNGTKIHVKKGNLINKHYRLPIEIKDFIFYKAQRALTVQQEISDKQWNRIDKDYRENMTQVRESEMFKALDQDYKLFGEAAFADRKA